MGGDGAMAFSRSRLHYRPVTTALGQSIGSERRRTVSMSPQLRM